MESSLAGKPERAGPVEVEDIRKDLLSDFSALPTLDAAQTENLQVFLRIRPFTSAESDSGEEQDCVTVEGSDTVILRAPRSIKSLPQTGQKFTFTQVFGPDSSQRAVFDGSVRTLVRDVLAGGNCLVFTYGVTNAGKTFTFLGPDHDSGLLPRSLSVIFNSIEGRLYQPGDLKPLRCRDFTRLTPEQQTEDSATKRTLLRLFKESDRSHTSMKSTFLDGSNLTDSSLSSDQDSFVVDDGGSAKFSVWVSFCEIYNDNIHDLLQHVPHGQQKRTVLRLSQDVKGNSFIKDLRWVQVSSSDEAYRIMKIGKKNQSMSSTRLNHLSSRSHSIFSVRLMKIDYVGGAARVLGISELSLCDLAGSERCSRTHNTGERLKEAGNINNSLLTLGKCISAMRNNQHSKFQQHIPFRESKLTHFLQFFFCGSSSGSVTMVVNINQSASCFDETLNVLKFSALAQKVVVLNSRPPPLAAALPRSAMEVSLIIDEAETRRFRGRKSSLVAWETSLEDVQEADDWETEETEEMEGDDLEDSLAEGEETELEETELEETVLEAAAEDTMDQGQQSHAEAALRLVLEAQIREEVSAEFMELFSKMEKDYSERLDKEREILEERAEKRVEILKNLVHKTVDLSALEAHRPDSEGMVLEDFLSAQELQKIREQQLNAAELEKQRKASEQQLQELQELQQSLQRRQEQLSELGDLCEQKEEIISKLTSALDQTVEDATRERSVVEAVRAELLQLQQNCSCLRERGSCGARGKEEKKRGRSSSDEESAPAKKRVLLEEEIWRLQEENDQKEQHLEELRLQHQEENHQKEQQITELRLQHQEENHQKEQQITELRLQHQEENWRLQEENDQKEQRLEELRLQHQEENHQKEQRLEELILQHQEENHQKEQQITELRLQHQEENHQKEQRLEELRLQLQEENRQQEQHLEELREEWEKLLRDLREERDQAKQKINELMEEKEQELEHLREENQQLEQLRLQLLEMETQMQKLSEEACPDCESVFQSLESEQRETSRLNKENKALVNGIFTLQTEVTTLKQTLRSETDRSSSLSDELNSTRTRLLSLQSQSDDRDLTLQELRGLQGAQQDAFHTAMERLKEESESALRESARRERHLQDLQEQLQQSQRLCADLQEQSSNQTTAFERVEAELKEQRDSFKRRLEAIENQRLQEEQEKHQEEQEKHQVEKHQAEQEKHQEEQEKHQAEKHQEEQEKHQEEQGKLKVERENKELRRLLSLREDTVTEAHVQMETLRKELERLREQLQEPEEEKVNQPQEQENQPQEEENQPQEKINQPQEEINHLEEINQAQEQEHENQLEEEKVNQPQEKINQLELEEHENQLEEEKINQLEEEHENQPQEHEDQLEEPRPVTVVEQLREEMRKHRLRRNNRKQETRDENSPEEEENLQEKELREQRRMEAVQREVQRFRELQNHSELQRAEGGASPERGSERSRKTPRTTSRKRKSCELQGLVFSENKRNRGRAGLLKQSSSSSVKDTTLTKLGEFINKSPSILSSTAKGLMGLVADGRSTGSRLKRGRRKLYKPPDSSSGASLMLDSPNTGGAAPEERESDHLTIKRQLRSQTRK